MAQGQSRGTDIRLSIRDTGVGILAEMLPRVFEPFVQADRSIERSQGGLGIGLSLAKNLVEMHGGRIEARSPGIGKGSEFIVVLPTVTEVEPLARTPKEIADAPASSVSSMRILIVDDNRDTVESLTMLMKMFRHTVGTADSGPAALQAASTSQWDAVLLDIGLPIIDGYEVARRIKSHSPATVLIAMTGFSQEEDREKSREAGFDHHLTKPVDPENLQRLLGVIAERSNLDG